MSSNITALPGAGASPCCSTTTLLGALAASFAWCFLLVCVFLCLRFLHLSRSRRHSARLLQEQQQPKRGLDAATIALLPLFPYRREFSTSASAECAVCLGVVDEGEMVRQLPGCKHVFHQGCIDVWLFSNASCPVCRGKVEPAARAEERAAAFVVPVEMLDDEMVASSSSKSGAVPPRPERLGARASGHETDLERQ